MHKTILTEILAHILAWDISFNLKKHRAELQAFLKQALKVVSSLGIPSRKGSSTGFLEEAQRKRQLKGLLFPISG